MINDKIPVYQVSVDKVRDLSRDAVLDLSCFRKGGFVKVVILAGGFGTRISEESHLKPKPMIEIGEMPILWHIMKIYAHFGFDDFVICLGYKGYVIKEYFANYYMHHSDITFDFKDENKMTIHNQMVEPWKVTLVDTGGHTMTGGRIKRIQPYVEDQAFMMTYGDGVSNVDIAALVAYHQGHDAIATVTGVSPPGRFGIMKLDNDQVTGFSEKPKETGTWINGGFFVLNPAIFDYIEGDGTFFEREPLERLANEGELRVFKHHGFWRPMDTMRDKMNLNDLWASGQAPWKVW